MPAKKEVSIGAARFEGTKSDVKRNLEGGQYVNIEELSRHLGIPRWTLYQWVSQQKIPHYKFGSLLRFKAGEIEAWTLARRREPRDLVGRGLPTE